MQFHADLIKFFFDTCSVNYGIKIAMRYYTFILSKIIMRYHTRCKYFYDEFWKCKTFCFRFRHDALQLLFSRFKRIGSDLSHLSRRTFSNVFSLFVKVKIKIKGVNLSRDILQTRGNVKASLQVFIFNSIVLNIVHAKYRDSFSIDSVKFHSFSTPSSLIERRIRYFWFIVRRDIVMVYYRRNDRASYSNVLLGIRIDGNILRITWIVI